MLTLVIIVSPLIIGYLWCLLFKNKINSKFIKWFDKQSILLSIACFLLLIITILINGVIAKSHIIRYTEIEEQSYNIFPIEIYNEEYYVVPIRDGNSTEFMVKTGNNLVPEFEYLDMQNCVFYNSKFAKIVEVSYKFKNPYLQLFAIPMRSNCSVVYIPKGSFLTEFTPTKGSLMY